MARPRKSAFGRLVGQCFGKVFQRYRNKARLSVHKIATKASVDPKYLYDLEKGTSVPSLEIIFRLTDALDVDAKEVVGKTRSEVRRNSGPESKSK